ncbi:MAG TPA: hypothetical protein VGE15_12315 [Sphingobacteriaceae bacterium]
MKTIATLTATFLIILAYSAIAGDATIVENLKDTRTIAAPVFSWGTPEEADTETAVLLKYSGISAPAQVWGSPEDLNEERLETLKVRNGISLEYPALNWGTPEDLDKKELENLMTAAHVIRFPELVIGDPQEIDACALN